MRGCEKEGEEGGDDSVRVIITIAFPLKLMSHRSIGAAS